MAKNNQKGVEAATGTKDIQELLKEEVPRLMMQPYKFSKPNWYS